MTMIQVRCGLVLLQQTDKQLLVQKEPSNNHKSSFLTYPKTNTVLRTNMANDGGDDGICYGLDV